MVSAAGHNVRIILHYATRGRNSIRMRYIQVSPGMMDTSHLWEVIGKG